MLEYTSDDLLKIIKEKSFKEKVINQICNDAKPASHRLGIFMAGSPGAGKTESAQNIKKNLTNGLKKDIDEIAILDIIHLEQDKIKTMIPGYDGKNAPLYQKPATRLLASVYKYILNNGLSFIHDTTFSHQKIAEENIQKAIDKKYIIKIYFVYQDPKNAWNIVKSREEKESRVVPRDSFVNQFINSRVVVNGIKSKFGDKIELNIIIKNIDTTTKEMNEKYIFNIDKIDSYIDKIYNNSSDIEDLIS